MSDLCLCRGIRKVKNGYIVDARWPIGDNGSGFGEVICKDLREALNIIAACDPDFEPAASRVGIFGKKSKCMTCKADECM